jgi:DNA-binding response OmpR family regulator
MTRAFAQDAAAPARRENFWQPSTVETSDAGGRLLVEQFGAHVFDPLTSTVRINGDRVALTAKEFGLALLFFRHLDRPLSREFIMNSVWGRMPVEGSRTLDAHVSQIRRRLRLIPRQGFRLASVYGYGYRLERTDHGAN